MPLVPYPCSQCGVMADKRGRAKGMCAKCYHGMARSRWSEQHRDQERARARTWHVANRVQRNAQMIGRRRRLRAEIIATMGAMCQCCGEKTPAFLTIDHVQNDGYKDRRTARHVLYRRILDEGCPPERYQILCWNCNGAKGLLGACPHSAT